MKNLVVIIGTCVVLFIGCALAMMSLELNEVKTTVSVIKTLPVDYNPYQKLYDEMLYPTVRIESISGIGSGVIINLECIDHVNAAPITTSGHSIFILTAAHVVGNNTSVTVTVYSYVSNTLSAFCELSAFVVITDTNKDLALLATEIHGITRTYSAKLAGKNYVPYLFTPVYAVGCSLGLNPRPSQGIITVINNPDNLRSSASHWEISAPILPGNSGGPVYAKRSGVPTDVGDASEYEIIGIAVWVKVYHGQLITTMVGIVPINQIYEFLNSINHKDTKNTKNSLCPSCLCGERK
jgi:S1-C subfamily serine protease